MFLRARVCSILRDLGCFPIVVADVPWHVWGWKIRGQHYHAVEDCWDMLLDMAACHRCGRERGPETRGKESPNRRIFQTGAPQKISDSPNAVMLGQTFRVAPFGTPAPGLPGFRAQVMRAVEAEEAMILLDLVGARTVSHLR